MGIGDWGLGIGDWAQSTIPNPQSPIPIKFYNLILNYKIFLNLRDKNLIIVINLF